MSAGRWLLQPGIAGSNPAVALHFKQNLWYATCHFLDLDIILNYKNFLPLRLLTAQFLINLAFHKYTAPA